MRKRLFGLLSVLVCAALATACAESDADITEKIKSQIGIEIDRRKIDLEEPIKRIGIYPIKVLLGGGLEPLVNVVVEGQEGDIELPADPDAE